MCPGLQISIFSHRLIRVLTRVVFPITSIATAKQYLRSKFSITAPKDNISHPRWGNPRWVNSRFSKMLLSSMIYRMLNATGFSVRDTSNLNIRWSLISLFVITSNSNHNNINTLMKWNNRGSQNHLCHSSYKFSREIHHRLIDLRFWSSHGFPMLKPREILHRCRDSHSNPNSANNKLSSTIPKRLAQHCKESRVSNTRGPF